MGSDLSYSVFFKPSLEDGESLPGEEGLTLENLEREILVEPGGRVRQAGADDTGPLIHGFKESCEQDLFLFAKGVLRRTRLTESLSLEMCQFLQDLTWLRKCLLIPRRHFKSTVAAQSLPLHVIIQPADRNVYRRTGWEPKAGRDYRILLGREVIKLSRATLRFIRTELEKNRLLRRLWPEVMWEDAKRQRVSPWSDDAILVNRSEGENYPEPTIQSYANDVALTGSGYDLHVLDDMITHPRIWSGAELESTNRNWSACRSLCDRFERLYQITIGTKWADPDLYSFIANLNKKLSLPEARVDFYRRAIVEGGKPIMPEFFSLAMVEELKEQYGTLFYFLFMNMDHVEGVSAFDLEKLRSYVMEGGRMMLRRDPRDLNLRKREKKGDEGGAPRSRRITTGMGRRMSHDEYDRYFEGGTTAFFQ